MSIRRVAMIGAFDPGYTRHAVIREGLEQVGVQVDVLNLPQRARTPQRIWHLWNCFFKARQYDAYIIGAFNQLTAPSAWLPAKLSRKPVLLDYFVGLTDVQVDRQSASGWRLRMYQMIDRFNLRRFDTLTDTTGHKEYFEQLLNIQINRMHIIPIGIRDSLADAEVPPLNTDSFLVQYLGSFIPFHHVETILQAANLLRDEPKIQFELIGDGQTFGQMQEIAKSLDLSNVTFTKGYFQPDELLPMLAKASVYLGVFGDMDRTRFAVPSKLYESMSYARPIVTASSPALHEFFTPGQDLLTVPPEDPSALAQTILKLFNDPDFAATVGHKGTETLQTTYRSRNIGAQIKDILEHLA